MPHLGYFGPDDVCFDTWVEELTRIFGNLVRGGDFSHVFDEGEQGQPAFVFERCGNKVHFSICDSEFSEGRSDAKWQQVEFGREDFLRAYQDLIDSLFSTLRKEAPPVGRDWISKRLLAGARPDDAPVLLDCDLWRDGGSLSATVADRGSKVSFWLQISPSSSEHEHLYSSKGPDPASKQTRIKISSTTERRWLAFLRGAMIDLVEPAKQEHFKRLLSILHHRS